MRIAATSTCKALMNTIIKLCDSAVTSKTGAKVLQSVLPVLLDKGMVSLVMRSRQSGKDQRDFFVLNPSLSCSPLSNDVFIMQFSDYSENSTEGCK